MTPPKGTRFAKIGSVVVVVGEERPPIFDLEEFIADQIRRKTASLTSEKQIADLSEAIQANIEARVVRH